MRKLKILTVFGTRPEAIKMAPLVLELKSRPEIEPLLCVTGQHRQMLDSVLDVFGLRPDFDLDIMRPDQTLEWITARVLEGIGEVLRREKPDLVLVHGDTTTTFSAALAAFYEKIPLGHVEAGLRTWDRYSPYPEELNRCMTARLAEYHFAPTPANAENLRNEAVAGRIFVTGNTVIDALKHTVGDGSFHTPELRSLDFENRRVVAMTCHRRENYGRPMENIFAAVRDIAEAFEDVEIVYPVHLSPVVREAAKRKLGDAPRVRLLEPLDAVEMHRLMAKSCLVLTDSGGLQEEAPALGKPVLVLRRETERPEAIRAGTVALAGTERADIFRLASELLNNRYKYESMSKAVNPYGDGRASERIADAVLYSFGYRKTPPEEFRV